MFFEMLAACAGIGAFLTPALGAVTVSSGNPGSCPASSDPAIVHVAWGLTNGSNPAYEIHVLENGTLSANLASSVTFFNKPVTNYFEGNSIVSMFTSNWVYTVQLVRISDGVVVQSQVSAEWAQLYGSCP